MFQLKNIGSTAAAITRLAFQQLSSLRTACGSSPGRQPTQSGGAPVSYRPGRAARGGRQFGRSQFQCCVRLVLRSPDMNFFEIARPCVRRPRRSRESYRARDFRSFKFHQFVRRIVRLCVESAAVYGFTSISTDVITGFSAQLITYVSSAD